MENEEDSFNFSLISWDSNPSENKQNLTLKNNAVNSPVHLSQGFGGAIMQPFNL